MQKSCLCVCICICMCVRVNNICRYVSPGCCLAPPVKCCVTGARSFSIHLFSMLVSAWIAEHETKVLASGCIMASTTPSRAESPVGKNAARKVRAALNLGTINSQICPLPNPAFAGQYYLPRDLDYLGPPFD